MRSNVNPYAAQPKPVLGHRVYEDLHHRLRELAEALNSNDFETSQAELLNGVLHFGTPTDPDGAAELLIEWRKVLAGSPSPGKL